MMTNASQLKKATLLAIIAARIIATHPALYAGHEADALKFAARQCPTKADALRHGRVLGLWA